MGDDWFFNIQPMVMITLTKFIYPHKKPGIDTCDPLTDFDTMLALRTPAESSFYYRV